MSELRAEIQSGVAAMTTAQRETLGVEIMKEVKRYDDGNDLTRRQLVDNILILFDQRSGPPNAVGNIQCECGHLFMDHQKPPIGTPWDICSFPCMGCDCQEFVANTRAADAGPRGDALFAELLAAFDSTRMGDKGINQGCWCVQSPTDTNQPDWKHEKHCKRNMALLKRCEAAATASPTPANVHQVHCVHGVPEGLTCAICGPIRNDDPPSLAPPERTEVARECRNPDWEGGMETSEHSYDKDGFCNYCGNKRPTTRVAGEQENSEDA